MSKSTELLRGMSTELLRETVPGLSPRYTTKVLTTDADILAARQLATSRFVEFGKIQEDALNPDGVLEQDPFLPHSVFFGAYEGDTQLLASTRLVWAEDSTVDDLRLPVTRLETPVAEFLLACSPGQIAEIGSLAKLPGTTNLVTLKLLREVLAFADAHDIQYLVCGLEPKILPTYQQLFGGALQRLHPENIQFPGIIGEQSPLIIDLHQSFDHQKEAMQRRKLGERVVGLAVRHFFSQQIPGLH